MDAAVLDELVEREARDLAAQRIERREHDSVRRVVDDEVDAREMLERTDVAALPPDDPAFEVVRGELDHRHRGLRSVARRDALERVGHKGSRASARVGAGFLLHLPHLPCELVPDEVLRALDELLSRLVHGEAGDLLERRERLALCVAQLFLERLDVHLAVPEALLLALEVREPTVDLELFLHEPLLDLGDLNAPVLELGFDLTPQRDGLLAGVDLRLPANGVGLALAVRDQATPLPSCDAHARARPREEHGGRRDRPDEDSDERCADREHGASAGGWVARGLTAGALTRRRPARPLPDCPEATSGCANPSGTGAAVAGGWYGSMSGTWSRNQKARACRKNIG